MSWYFQHFKITGLENLENQNWLRKFWNNSDLCICEQSIVNRQKMVNCFTTYKYCMDIFIILSHRGFRKTRSLKLWKFNVKYWYEDSIFHI